jgi:hypothetical protein
MQLRMATEVKNRMRGSYSASDAEAFTGMKQQRDIAPGWNPSLFVARMQHLIA